MAPTMYFLRGSLRHCIRGKALRSSPTSHWEPRRLLSQRPLPTLSSKAQHHPGRRPDFSSPNRARAISPIIALGLLIGGVSYCLLDDSSASTKALNDTTFVPYTITSREAISATSFIITITPRTPNPSLPYLHASSSQWKWPLWSVEFKQPEVQISRHYTPLPPQDDEDPADGSLRFYIRAVGDGEMSNYLCRRAVGQDVWLRGPHVGFELKERLGDQKDLVVLAGGTGVVPGIQAAKAILDHAQDTEVTLLWAVRRREEIQSAAPPRTSSWKFWREKQPTVVGLDLQHASPVASRLMAMKAGYGDRLKIQVVVDEEETQFRDKNIKAALSKRCNDANSVFAPLGNGCPFHYQEAHERTCEFQTPGEMACNCNHTGRAGKSLFIVSGPDGFISHYAGPKVWLGGRQTQGPVAGIIGQLQRQHPQLAQDWLVLKM